ncbi:MAG: rRNA maturation RNase YbeY [Candidatus Taylorbacteria bacterium]|nr:rRNA maturation RNase YbeY [Candidatus Taylorbacteria bacterium]
MTDINFHITNTTKAKLPDFDFLAMKNAILGKKYELSVIIINKQGIKELNREYREINKPTDILGFPLSDNFGEIYINPEMTRLEAKKFKRTYNNFFAFLFIHGLVHLKGFDHGSTMESIEARFRKKFGI